MSPDEYTNVSAKVSNKMSTDKADGEQWEKAIADATEELRVVTRRKARLEQAIRVFRRNKKDGIEWPKS